MDVDEIYDNVARRILNDFQPIIESLNQNFGTLQEFCTRTVSQAVDQTNSVVSMVEKLESRITKIELALGNVCNTNDLESRIKTLEAQIATQRNEGVMGWQLGALHHRIDVLQDWLAMHLPEPIDDMPMRLFNSAIAEEGNDLETETLLEHIGVGFLATLRGLQHASELNGSLVRISGPMRQNCRFPVHKLDSEGKTVKVLAVAPKNLMFPYCPNCFASITTNGCFECQFGLPPLKADCEAAKVPRGTFEGGNQVATSGTSPHNKPMHTSSTFSRQEGQGPLGNLPPFNEFKGTVPRCALPTCMLSAKSEFTDSADRAS